MIIHLIIINNDEVFKKLIAAQHMLRTKPPWLCLINSDALLLFLTWHENSEWIDAVCNIKKHGVLLLV